MGGIRSQIGQGHGEGQGQGSICSTGKAWLLMEMWWHNYVSFNTPSPAAKMWRSCQSDKNLKSVSRLDGSCLHGQADTHVGVCYCFEAELPVAQAASLGTCFSATNFDKGQPPL